MSLQFMRTSLLRDTDDSSGGGGSPNPDKDKNPDPKKEDKKDDQPTEEKIFTQKDVDAIVKDRLAREKDKTEKEKEKARKEAEERSLAENAEWQKLAETRANEITDLTRKLEQIEPEFAAAKERIKKYETALSAQLDSLKKDLPDYVLALLEKLDPVDQLEYIAQNAESIRKQPNRPVPPTPNPKDADLSGQRKEDAARAANVFYRSRF